MGKGWQSTLQVLVPIVNQYGERYKKVRLNMAVLSKEAYISSRPFLKASGGLFGQERYGLDVKSMYVVNDWLALELQAGWTGFCSMAVNWEASIPKRWTALAGANIYLNRFMETFTLASLLAKWQIFLWGHMFPNEPVLTKQPNIYR